MRGAEHGSERDPDGEFAIGPAGVPFPAEREWLDTPLPAEVTAEDFVVRTIALLQYEGLVRESAADGEPLLRDVLASFAAPAPSKDFVERTLAALSNDRTNWRELLDRHTVPEPSPQFVSRTLDALRLERADTAAQPGRNRWLWPLLAAAAVALAWLADRGGDGAPVERRLAQRSPAAFAYAYAPTPLPAVLAAVRQDDDPQALPDAAADATWLLLGGAR